MFVVSVRVHFRSCQWEILQHPRVIQEIELIIKRTIFYTFIFLKYSCKQYLFFSVFDQALIYYVVAFQYTP